MTIFILFLSFINICFSAIFYIKKRGFELWDPFLIFLGFFLLYPILGETYRAPADLFVQEVYIKSSFLVLIASLGVLSAVLILRFKTLTQNLDNKLKFDINPVLLDLATYSVFIVGYLAMYYYYDRFGGILEFFSYGNRIERNSMVRNAFGNIPYSTVLYAGVILSMLSGLVRIKKSESIFVSGIFIKPLILISPLLIFHLLDGERSHLLKYLIVFLVFYGLIFGIKKSKSFFIIAIFVGLFFALIGAFRGPINLYFSGDHVGASRFTKLIVSKMPASLIPIEFAAVQSTLHYIVSKEDYKRPEYGATYFQSFEYLVPRSFLPYPKKKTISDRIGEEWGKEYYKKQINANLNGPNPNWRIQPEKNSYKKFGLGMSPIAEAYINFRYTGVYLFFLLISYYFAILKERLQLFNIFSFGFYLVSCFLVLAIFRSSFAGIFSYLFYLYFFVNIPLFGVVFFGYLLRKIKHEH